MQVSWNRSTRTSCNCLKINIIKTISYATAGSKQIDFHHRQDLHEGCKQRKAGKRSPAFKSAGKIIPIEDSTVGKKVCSAPPDGSSCYLGSGTHFGVFQDGTNRAPKVVFFNGTQVIDVQTIGLFHGHSQGKLEFIAIAPELFCPN